MLVTTWVSNNPKSCLSDMILTLEIIERFVMLPSRAHILDREFLGALVPAGDLKRKSRPIVEGKKKKKTRITSRLDESSLARRGSPRLVLKGQNCIIKFLK